MRGDIVVVTGDEGNAATREASALAQEPRAALRREVDRVVERTVEQTTAEVVTEVPASPSPPASPAMPRITIERDGKKIVIPAGPPAGALAQAQHPDFVFAPQIPTEAVVISIAFFVMLAFIAVGLPLARAFARRMDRQAAGAGPAAFPSHVGDRIERIEHAVEAIAIEVERVSEGQRFTTKLLSELRAPAALSAAVPGQFGGEAR